MSGAAIAFGGGLGAASGMTSGAVPGSMLMMSPRGKRVSESSQ